MSELRPRAETRDEQVVILCGGQGTRMREETEFRPKALVEIGGWPVLWHLMRIYDHFGYRRFVLCLGYRGEMIKEYFLDYHWRNRDFALRLGDGAPTVRGLGDQDGGDPTDWEIVFADTGQLTNTGGRLHRVRKYVDGDRFLANYCDGLSDVDLDALLSFHDSHGKVATLTGFHPRSRFGVVRIDDDGVVNYWQEKPLMSELTSGGFFVFEKRIFDYLDDDCVLELGPFERLADDREMALYQHDGFWQSMDTFKEAQTLNRIWERGNAPWRIWS